MLPHEIKQVKTAAHESELINSSVSVWERKHEEIVSNSHRGLAGIEWVRHGRLRLQTSNVREIALGVCDSFVSATAERLRSGEDWTNNQAAAIWGDDFQTSKVSESAPGHTCCLDINAEHNRVKRSNRGDLSVCYPISAIANHSIAMPTLT